MDLLVSKKKYEIIYKKYDEILETELDEHKKVGWNRPERCIQRYDLIISLCSNISMVQGASSKLLDVGCGLCGLYKRIKELNVNSYIKYSGLDISRKFINESRALYNDIDLIEIDIIKDGVLDLNSYDFIVLNGVFTQRFDLTHDEMIEFMKQMVQNLKMITTGAIIFNVMSPYSDYMLDGSFHLDIDDCVKLLHSCGITKFDILIGTIPYEIFVKLYV